MKVAAAVILLVGLCVAAAPAPAQRKRDKDKDDRGPLDRACPVADCFHERQIRDFEVVDRTNVIVYVGSQRCAFHVEVYGTSCDLTFAPDLYFRRTTEMPDGLPRGDDLPDGGGGLVDPFDIRRERRDLQVCSNDLSVQVHGGVFTESNITPRREVDRFGQPRIRTDCRVRSVRSITDDELIEFYVDHEVAAPIPPIGPGNIEVGEQEEEPAAATAP